MNSDELRKSLNAEKPVVKARIDAAVEAFYNDPSGKNLANVYMELAQGIIYKVPLYAPVFHAEDGQNLSQINIPGFGKALILCTSPEEAKKTDQPEYKEVIVKGTFMQAIAEESLAGVVFNTGHKSVQGGWLFADKEYLQGILQVAQQTIDEQPEEVRAILLENPINENF